MKIVIDARLYGIENGGLGRYLVNLIDQISKLDKEDKFIVLLRKRYYDSLKFPENWKKELIDFRHYSLKEQIELPRKLKSLNADLVHFPHFNVPVMFTGDFIVTIHDLLMHKSKGRDATTLPKHLYFLKRVGYKKVFSKAVYDSKKIIVPSKTVKADLLKEYKVDKEKIEAIYEGLDQNIVKHSGIRTIKRQYKIERDYFIYAGNAYPHKNLERAIEAMAFLNNGKSKKVYLLISTPKNVFVQKLQDQIKKLKAEDSVKILGFVPDRELGVLIRNSIGFLYPSLQEGFGLQGLEAIANETLLVASDIPAFKEVYKDNAIYFNPFDFSSIEKAMSDAIEMPAAKRKKIIKKAVKFIQRYSWEENAKKTIAIYHGT